MTTDRTTATAKSRAGEPVAFTIGKHEFRSRLIIGTGKYASFEQNLACAEASGAEMVTVALRRVNFDAAKGPRLLDVISPERFTILPNTAGCYTADDAVTTAQLGRELLETDLVKLEVIGDERTLFPDVPATLEAAKRLIADGFTVLPYITDDPVACQRLAGMGCPAVMPLAAPIGSGIGIRNPANLRIILETVEVPVIVDAGVGTASDAAIAMELGATALLMNTAIALAKDPVKMAIAMRKAVEAGRAAYEAGRMPKRLVRLGLEPVRWHGSLLARDRSSAPCSTATRSRAIRRPSRRRLFEAGVDWIQLRDRKLEAAVLLRLARSLVAARDAVNRTKADAARARRVIVNKRADVALAAGADGVHLGLDALDPRTLDSLAPGALRIGASRRIRSASSKRGSGSASLSPTSISPRSGRRARSRAERPALGLEVLAHAARIASRAGVPLLAQGGVDAKRAAAAVAAGAAGIAVTGDIGGARRPRRGCAGAAPRARCAGCERTQRITRDECRRWLRARRP